jgi:hypothetical protein
VSSPARSAGRGCTKAARAPRQLPAHPTRPHPSSWHHPPRSPQAPRPSLGGETHTSGLQAFAYSVRSLGSQKVARLGWMVAAAFNARPRISQTHSSGFSPSTPGHGPPDTPLECTLTVASLKPHRHPRKEPLSHPNGHHLPHRHIRRSLPPALQHHPPRNANPLPPPSPPNPNQHQPSIRQTTVFEP